MASAETTRSEARELNGPSARLYVRRYQPPGQAWARLGLLHGYGDHSGRYVEFLAWLAERGVDAWALDFRGHGKSKGIRGSVLRWEEYLEDLNGFLQELQSDSPPLFLLGHSHGGLVLAAAAERGLPDVRGLIFSAPYLGRRLHVPAYKDFAARCLSAALPHFSLPTGMDGAMMTSDEEMIRESNDDPLILSCATSRWYITAHEAQTEVFSQAEKIKLPLLLLAGDADPIADTRAAHDFYLRAGSEDKTFRLYPDLLHEILRETGRQRIYANILDWLRERA